jgi:hypothetical protein
MKPPRRTAGTKTAWVTMRVHRGSPSGALRSDIAANAVRNAANPAEWSSGCCLATLAVTNPPSKPTPAMPTRKAIKRMSQPAAGEKTASENMLISNTNGTTRQTYPANTATTPRDSVRHPASQETSSSVSTLPIRTRPANSSTLPSNSSDPNGQGDIPVNLSSILSSGLTRWDSPAPPRSRGEQVQSLVMRPYSFSWHT